MSFSKPLSDFWAWYKKSLKENPIETKALTSATLSFLGNVVAQKVIERRPLDLQRTIKFASWGMVMSPIVHFWYMFLEKTFRGKNNTNIPKLLLDQFAFSPLLNMLFFTFMAILDGQPSRAPTDIKNTLWPALKASWKYWPLVQYINFTFVPVPLRNLFGSLAAFLWNIYFAVLTQRAKQQITIPIKVIVRK